MRLLLFTFLLLFKHVDGSGCTICDLLGEDSGENTVSEPESKVQSSGSFSLNKNGRFFIEPSAVSQEDGDSMTSFHNRINTVSTLAKTLLGQILGGMGSQLEIHDNKKRQPKGDSDDVVKSIFDVFDTTFNGVDTVNTLLIRGPHVCVREKVLNLSSTKDDSYLLKKFCHRYTDAMKCHSQRSTPEKSTETIRYQECCEGFTTKDIQDGCDIIVPNKSINDILEERNISSTSESYTDSTFVVDDDDQLFIFNSTIRDYDMEAGQHVQTIDNQNTFIVSQKEKIQMSTFLNCRRISRSNVKVSEGLVHYIEGTLRPATANIVDTLEKDGRFTVFLSLLSDETIEQLKSNEKFTVFAFTDATVENMDKRLQKHLKEKKFCAKNIDRSHVVNSSYCSQAFSTSEPLVALDGTRLSLSIDYEDDVISIESTEIVERDFVTTNGVVHIIDDVLKKERLESWDIALEKHNKELADQLVDKLGDGVYTIISPPQSSHESNDSSEVTDSLNNVIQDTIIDLEDPKPVLLKTYQNNTIFAGLFEDPGLNNEFRAGKSMSLRMSVKIQEGKPKYQIGCSRFTEQPPIRSCNSAIVFVDKPIPVVTQNISSFLQSREDLSSFYDLWKRFNVLNKPKSLVKTLLVPSNDAFSPNQLKKLQKNRKEVANFILTHTIDRPLCDFNLAQGTRFTVRPPLIVNSNGDDLHYKHRDDDLYIEDSRTQDSHILSDGIIYVMDSIITRNAKVTDPSSAFRHVTDLLNIFHRN